MEKQAIVVIAGPTASGKTSLSIELAKRFSGEIISADSMQIYKKMDIGTAKPAEAEKEGIPHHMIDIIEPCENFSVADYVAMAHGVIADVIKRGKLPIICGGTGLYINSLVDDVAFCGNKADEAVRAELLEYLKREGIEKLFERLSECDPEAAKTIHPNNTKRVMRAIEFFETTGKKISEQSAESKKIESRYLPLMMMIDRNREELYQRIDMRVDIMMENGLIEEVRGLLKEGIKGTAMQAIGYKEVADYLKGFSTKDEMIRIIKRDSRHYAKRQLTWFKRDERIIRLEDNYFNRAAELIENRIERG